MTLDNMQHELAAILPNGFQRQTMLDNYAALRTLLGEHGAAERVAKAMVDELTRNKL
jgi:lipid A disaccharide synthetase